MIELSRLTLILVGMAGALQSADLPELFATSTADICALPFEGGVGEPSFCRPDEPARLSTPFFSVNIDPNFLVGVDSGGRRVYMPGSIRQSMAGFDMRVVEPDNPALDRSGWSSCDSFSSANAEGTMCDRSDEVVYRRYVLREDGNALVIDLVVGTTGMTQLPLLEQMIDSVDVHAH